MLEHLKSKDDFAKNTAKGIVLVDFFAQWCGPCNMLTPILEEIVSENPDYNVLKVDVDEFPELASQFNVASIPTLVVLKDGGVVNRHVGFCEKDKIKEMFSC